MASNSAGVRYSPPANLYVRGREHSGSLALTLLPEPPLGASPGLARPTLPEQSWLTHSRLGARRVHPKICQGQPAEPQRGVNPPHGLERPKSLPLGPKASLLSGRGGEDPPSPFCVPASPPDCGRRGIGTAPLGPSCFSLCQQSFVPGSLGTELGSPQQPSVPQWQPLHPTAGDGFCSMLPSCLPPHGPTAPLLSLILTSLTCNILCVALV